MFDCQPTFRKKIDKAISEPAIADLLTGRTADQLPEN